MLVQFKIMHAQTKMGENLVMVGNQNIGSNWDIKKALHFQTQPNQYPSWTALN